MMLALQRRHAGGVATLGGRWLDGGFPTLGYLAEVFGGLIDTGLVALADPGPAGYGGSASPIAGTLGTRSWSPCSAVKVYGCPTPSC